MDISSLLSARFEQHPRSRGWVLEIMPPIPEPDGQLVYYASARRFRPGLSDGHEVAALWAKADQRGNVTLLTDAVTLLGIESVRPMTGGEIALFEELEQAGPLEQLWRRATHDSAAAMLLRRRYCFWSKVKLVSRDVLARHPDVAAFLDCARVTIAVEPVAPPAPDSLIWPEFLRRYGKGNNIWQPRKTPPLPVSWPMTRGTSLNYYVWSIRVLQADEVPKRRETTEPWGIVVRAGVGGSIAFSALHALPPSLGVQQGRRPSDGHFALSRELGDLDAALLRATHDPAIADGVRRYYQEWLLDEPLLAPLVMPNHPAFEAFVRES